MNGAFAVLTVALGFTDMMDNHCPHDGCFAEQHASARNSFSAGYTYFQRDRIGEELYYRHDQASTHGPWQKIWGISATSDGGIWVGMGHAYTIQENDQGPYVELHAMTGLFERGDGPDLGGPIEFRSGIEFGYEWENGLRLGLSYDHRSNAGIYKRNPGIETLQIRLSAAIK